MGVNLQVLPQKSPEATLIVPFNFLSLLPNGQTISSATVTASVWTGTDPSPSTILSGVATPSGQIVNQTVQAGVAGNIYKLRCAAVASDGSTQVLVAYLAVVEDPL
ncbi:MAG: hypothetical protein KGL39_56865 [Patescibacteria group bacterium]|nr:hypothetical protein [Patescibacteria group bacterium]